MTFEDYCDKAQIYHFREAFYHHLCAKGWAIEAGFGIELDEERLGREWEIFLHNVLRKETTREL